MKEQQLINAVKTASILEIERLINEGVDINVIDSNQNSIGYGWTPLHYCIFRGGAGQNKKYNEVAELLLKNGSKSNINNFDNENSVEFAVKFFALDILDLLIKNGADIYKTEENLFDVILDRYYAEQRLDENHIEDIESDQEKEAIKKGEGESLKRMYKRIDSIVKNGYDLNTGEFSAAYCTILEINSNRLPAQVLLYLFKKGANPLECLNPDTERKNPLFNEACYQKLPNEILIEYAKIIGINSAFKELPNYTLIVIAVSNNNLELVSELIKLKSDLHHNNDFSLRIACKNGFFEIVRLLVEKGASIDIIDQHGVNPIQIAENSGFLQIADYLKSKL